MIKFVWFLSFPRTSHILVDNIELANSKLFPQDAIITWNFGHLGNLKESV